MFYIVVPESIKRKDPLFMYEDTATNLKSARSKVYYLVKTYPNKHIFVYDADPTGFRSVADIIRHRRGWGFKSTGYYWTKGDKSYKLKADGTIE